MKVTGPNSVTLLKWAPIFEWCVECVDIKKRLCVEKRLDINSQHHNWGDLYDLQMMKRVFTLIMNNIFI
jgi:hypothetical protein